MSRLRRQGAWAVLDQVLSSGTNFLPALLLARVLGPTGFGVFSLAFLSWFGALAVVRSALMQPYTLAASSLEGDAWRDVTRRAGGAVVLAGFAWGVIFAVVAAAVGLSSDIGRALLVVAVLAPGLVLQEFWRVAAFSASRARTAAANDFCWAVCQVVAFGALLVIGDVTVAGSLIAWGVGAWVAAGLGAVQLSVTPTMNRAALHWARQRAALGAWFTATSTTFTMGILGVAVIVAAQTGNSGLGLFRTVQNLFGPVQLLTIGAESVFLPHLVRAIQRAGDDGVGESRRYSFLMTAAVTAYGLALLAAAHTVLTGVFGSEFAPATVLVLPTLIAFSIDAVASGAQLQLRAQARGARLLVAQLAATGTRLIAVAALAAAFGLRGAAWGLVAGSAIGAVVAWIQVALAVRREPGRGAGARSTPPVELQLAARTDL